MNHLQFIEFKFKIINSKFTFWALSVHILLYIYVLWKLLLNLINLII